MSKEDRRTSRREQAKKDKESSGGDFKRQRGWLATDEELENLGIGEYRTASEEDGGEKLHKIHIIPAHPDDPDLIALKLYLHYDVGPDGASFLCPKWMKNYLTDIGMEIPAKIADGRCPLCEEHERMLERYKKEKEGLNEEDRKKLYADVRKYHPFSGGFSEPKPKRLFAWVVDGIDEAAEEEGVKFFLMPTSVYEKGVIDLSHDPDEKDESGDELFVDILDPKKGQVFMFKRAGKGWQNTEYSSYRIKPRKWDLTDWLKDRPRYFDVLRFHGYDEIAATMSLPPSTDDPDEAKTRTRDRKDVGDGLEREFKRERSDDGKSPGEDDPPRRRRRPAGNDEEPNPMETKPDPDDMDDPDENVSDDVKNVRERVRRRRATKDE